MRLCAIGTSNTVMLSGYLAGVEQTAIFSKIDRYCIGGACSFLLQLEKDKIDYGSFDVCVIDTCINDEIHIRRGIVDPLDVILSLTDFITHARSQGVMPVVLALPSADLIGKPRVAYEIHRSVANRLNVPFFDGYHWLKSTYSSIADENELFRDIYHLDIDRSLEIGVKIAHFIRKSNLDDPQVFSPSLGATFKRLPIGSLVNGSSVTHRSNSIRRDDFVQIDVNDVMEIDVGDGWHICGFVFNAALSCGFLTFSGQSELHKNLNTALFFKAAINKKIFMSQLAPVRQNLGLTGRVRIQLSETSEKSEALINSRPKVPEGHEARVELGDVIVVGRQ